MKQMRYLFLALALSFGLCARQSQAQTVGQTMTFSIVCQYVTNLYTTNTTTGVINQDQHLTTVLVDTPNIVKAILVDLFWTSNSTAWHSNYARWESARLVYEENMTNGHQGIYLRVGDRQTNVSSFFTNSFSTNGCANMFSQDAAKVIGGTIYPAITTNGYADVSSPVASNLFDETVFPSNSLPLTGGFGYLEHAGTSNNYTSYDNLAYLTLTTSNTSFTLFGLSQGLLVDAVYAADGGVGKVDQAEIIGAGTFSLNLSTNFLRLTNGFRYDVNLSDTVVTNYLVTNAVPAANYTGLAHGTVYVRAPYRLDFGPPEGP
jgi:hypothetical protein